SEGGRPKRTPCAFARARPAPVLARINSRSNSARPPSAVSISRPCGVVVSAQASPSDLKSAPALPTASRMLSKPRAPGEPVEPRHHQHVAGFEAFDHFGQLGPVGLRATDLLRVDLYAAGGPELCILRGEALAVRAHPGVAVDWHHLSRLL